MCVCVQYYVCLCVRVCGCVYAAVCVWVCMYAAVCVGVGSQSAFSFMQQYIDIHILSTKTNHLWKEMLGIRVVGCYPSQKWQCLLY